MSITETLSEILQVPVKKPTGRRRRFGWLPKDVMSRSDISSSAKIVLLCMNMESYGTGIVGMSDSWIGVHAGVSRPQVIACKKMLERAALISKFGKPVKQVQWYRLLHPDMCGKLSVPEISDGSTKVLTKRELTPCILCKTLCKPSRMTGWCMRCTNESRNRVITRELVREEVKRAVSQ